MSRCCSGQYQSLCVIFEFFPCTVNLTEAARGSRALCFPSTRQAAGGRSQAGEAPPVQFVPSGCGCGHTLWQKRCWRSLPLRGAGAQQLQAGQRQGRAQPPSPFHCKYGRGVRLRSRPSVAGPGRPGLGGRTPPEPHGTGLQPLGAVASAPSCPQSHERHSTAQQVRPAPARLCCWGLPVRCCQFCRNRPRSCSRFLQSGEQPELIEKDRGSEPCD